jgi:hypothetical protein
MALMFLFSLIFVPKGRAPEKVAEDAFE